MTTVDRNRLVGNAAGARVADLLSASCLVRPVAADTDVGVDFYCETVHGDDPFLHFWVQVKGGASQCRILKDGLTASCSFDMKHLHYWLRQPVPVFAALVPESGSNSRVFVVNVTRQLLEAGLKDPQQSQTLRSDLLIESRDGARVWLDEMVPATTALMSCRRGVISSFPYLKPQYFKEMPTAPVDLYSEEILRQLRTTAAWSLMFMHRRRVLASLELTDFRSQLQRVLSQFPDDRHWENFAVQAYCSHIAGDFGTAIAFYDEAISDIANDPHCVEDPAWQAQQSMLATQKQLAIQGLPLY